MYAARGSAETRDWSMLVLSRKKDECIVINNDITIVVVEIRGDKVRLGVEAPKEVPVHRREVFDAISMVGGTLVGGQLVGGKIGADEPTDAAAQAIDQSCVEQNASPAAPQTSLAAPQTSLSAPQTSLAAPQSGGKSGDGPGANAVETGGISGQHLQGQHLQGPCELEARVDG